mgnify:FL=1
MDLGLEGRTALITGSSRGIGRAIALCLAKEGANVVICSRNRKELDDLETKIIDEHGVVVGSYEVDAANPESINTMFHEVKREIVSIDILVNNVGNLEKFGKFEDLEDRDWIRMYELGFMSAIRFIRATLPWLKKSNQASIINISSLSGHQPSFGGFNPHYSTTKAGVINLTKNLANDFGRYGITVNTLCPSTLAGGGWDNNVVDRAKREGITKEKAEKIMRAEESEKSPLGKIGELNNIANKVLYLASSVARFETGNCYNIDGGITRSIL